MGGIGNTIETDLVGELVEVHAGYSPGHRLFRGLVRAVTGTPHGQATLWVEAVEREYYMGVDFAPGDVATFTLSVGFYGDDSTWLRIIRPNAAKGTP